MSPPDGPDTLVFEGSPSEIVESAITWLMQDPDGSICVRRDANDCSLAVHHQTLIFRDENEINHYADGDFNTLWDVLVEVDGGFYSRRDLADIMLKHRVSLAKLIRESNETGELYRHKLQSYWLGGTIGKNRFIRAFLRNGEDRWA